LDISPEVLKRSIESLFRLQEIDAQLFQLNLEEKTIPPEYSEIQDKMAETLKAIKSIERSLRDVDRERRGFELRVLTLQEDLKKAEAKRRDVRNTKEEFAASKEHENFQKKLVETKKALTEKTELTTQKSQQLEEKQKAVKEFEEKFQGLDETRKSRMATLQAEKDKLIAQREAHISQVDEQIFSLYERVQRIRKGNGVALVQGLVCSGCHVSIPPHTRSRLEKMEEIITCPSCSRILYLHSEEIIEHKSFASTSAL